MCEGLSFVIHSIVSGDALIETVLNNYPLGTRSCRLYKRGLNDTYLVETEGERLYPASLSLWMEN